LLFSTILWIFSLSRSVTYHFITQINGYHTQVSVRLDLKRYLTDNMLHKNKMYVINNTCDWAGWFSQPWHYNDGTYFWNCVSLEVSSDLFVWAILSLGLNDTDCLVVVSSMWIKIGLLRVMTSALGQNIVCFH